MKSISRLFALRSIRMAVPALALIAGMPLLASTASDIADRVDRYKILGNVYKDVTDDLRRGSPNMATCAPTPTPSAALRNCSMTGFLPAADRAVAWILQQSRDLDQPDGISRCAGQVRVPRRSFREAVATGDLDAMRSASRLLGAAARAATMISAKNATGTARAAKNMLTAKPFPPGIEQESEQMTSNRRRFLSYTAGGMTFAFAGFGFGSKPRTRHRPATIPRTSAQPEEPSARSRFSGSLASACTGMPRMCVFHAGRREGCGHCMMLDYTVNAGATCTSFTPRSAVGR